MSSFRKSGHIYACRLLKGKEHGKIYANFIGQIFSLDVVETDDTIFKISRIHYGGKIS